MYLIGDYYMNLNIKFKQLLLAFGIILMLQACHYPFNTASDEWNITFSEEKAAYKKAFLNRIDESFNHPDLPNIIIIMADDLGKAEVSAYGLQYLKTPNIDKIAAEGVLFNDCYVTSPVCSPSRAAILTGRYPNRFGFETQLMEFYPKNMMVYTLGKSLANTDRNILNTEPVYPPKKDIEKQGVPPSEINIAELLKTKNYNTAYIGKWHEGYSPEHIPNIRGFDYQYGFYGAFTIYTKKKNSPGTVNYIQDIFTSKYQWKNGRKGTSAILRNNVEIQEERYLTNAFVEEAVDYIAANKNKDNPFFLCLAFNAPHVPFQAPQDYYDMHADIKDENKRVYYAMIHSMDDAIGQLMDELTSMGLDDNTLVFFISDNGAATYTGATDNFPYKGGKMNWFEGGINVPFMVKWKNHIPAGEVYEKPVSSMDIFATIAKATHMELPGDRVYDGVDLISFISDEKEGYPHENLYWRADYLYAMRNKDWKFLMSTRDNWAELYHISEDKYEHFNLEEKYSDTLKTMLKEFDFWQKGLSDPMWPRLIDIEFVIDGKTYLFPS
jgi:arylsulfatase A-like enzyme